MTTSYTDGGCGPVTKVGVRIAQAIGEVMFNTGLIFCAGVPIAVFPWERSPHGESRAVTVPLDPQHLHKTYLAGGRVPLRAFHRRPSHRSVRFQNWGREIAIGGAIL